MSDDPAKLERPLFIEMDFGEALVRYAQAKPEEVQPAPGRKLKNAKEPKPLGAPRADPSTD